MKTPFIAGKHIYLRGIEREELPNLVKWMSDSEMTYFLFMGERPAHLELVTEQWNTSIRDNTCVELAIMDIKKDKMTGWTGLYRINWVSRTAEYRIFIGEKNNRNKGIGTEVARLMLNYAFEKLNMNKVWLGVNSLHKGACRSYEKAGFVKEGVLRQEIFRNNQYYDATRMSILRKEYERLK